MRESSEVELKYLLESDADLEKLAAGLPGFESELKQQNIYLDQNGMLREQGVLLRIRLENGTGEVTIKRSGGISDGVSMALESSEELTGTSLQKIEEGDFMGALADLECLQKLQLPGRVRPDQLREWGRIRNRRRRFRLAGDWLVELDRAEFPDGSIRREVELESADPEGARQVMEPILRNLGLRWVVAEESKSCQLFRILENSSD